MKVSRENLLTFGGALTFNDLREIGDGMKQRGALCILPSDTGYSLAAYPSHQRSMPRLEKILPHLSNQPIPLCFPTLQMLWPYVRLTQMDIRLMDKCLPGPLTLVCEMNQKLPRLRYNAIFHTNNTLGFRISDSNVERQICLQIESPITTCAIRGDNKQIITNFDDAVDIVNEALKGEVEPFVVYAVKEREIKYPDHSTVATVQGHCRVHIYREGVVEQKKLQKVIDSLSYSDIDDWT